MFVHTVRFSSGLQDDRIQELYRSRLSEYDLVPGLLQKFYLRYEDGQYGGIYVWDSPESFHRFRQTELSRTIGEVYQVSESTLGAAEVVLTLHPLGSGNQPAAAPH